MATKIYSSISIYCELHFEIIILMNYKINPSDLKLQRLTLDRHHSISQSINFIFKIFFLINSITEYQI